MEAWVVEGELGRVFEEGWGTGKPHIDATRKAATEHEREGETKEEVVIWRGNTTTQTPEQQEASRYRDNCVALQ